jgi:hypothetical protein
LKIITNDYGCGTSSSILDYNIEDVCVVSESDWEKVFDLNDDVFLVGHDFLFYMWDTPEKIQKWKSYPHAKLLWCFERIDAIIDIWMQKSHLSLRMASQFVDEIYACDEDDCNKYNLKWMPQWASRRFFDQRNKTILNQKILFSGQAGKIEYGSRTALLAFAQQNVSLKDKIQITNISRSLTWDDYIDNFLSYGGILNPIGLLKGLNTRAYEALYSGRILLQQTLGPYERHQDMLKDFKNVKFFETSDDLIRIIENESLEQINEISAFEKNSLFERFRNIGIEIK